MKFILVRFILAVLFFAIPHFISTRFVLKWKRWLSLLTSVALVFFGMVLFYQIPVENAFVTFKTPEEVVSYYKFDYFRSIEKTHEITLEGKESAVFLFNDSSIIMVKKVSGGYKLCGPANPVGFCNTAKVDTFFVYRAPGTKDYYLIGSSDTYAVNDDYNSEFKFSDGCLTGFVCGAYVNYDGDIKNYKCYIDGSIAPFFKTMFQRPSEE